MENANNQQNAGGTNLISNKSKKEAHAQRKKTRNTAKIK